MDKIRELTARIKLEPKTALLYAKRGQCYVHLEDWNSALADTNAALALNPTNTSYYVARADIYNAMGKHDLEKQDLEKAVELNPKDVESLKELAVFDAMHKNCAESCLILSRAIAIEPHSVELYLFRAEALLVLKDFAGATADCNQAFKLEPGSKKAMLVMNEIRAVQKALKP
jgi:tetratricopeptide (TPR) repeat protein